MFFLKKKNLTEYYTWTTAINRQNNFRRKKKKIVEISGVLHKFGNLCSTTDFVLTLWEDTFELLSSLYQK